MRLCGDNGRREHRRRRVNRRRTLHGGRGRNDGKTSQSIHRNGSRFRVSQGVDCVLMRPSPTKGDAAHQPSLRRVRRRPPLPFFNARFCGSPDRGCGRRHLNHGRFGIRDVLDDGRGLGRRVGESLPKPCGPALFHRFHGGLAAQGGRHSRLRAQETKSNRKFTKHVRRLASTLRHRRGNSGREDCAECSSDSDGAEFADFEDGFDYTVLPTDTIDKASPNCASSQPVAQVRPRWQSPGIQEAIGMVPSGGLGVVG